MPFIASDTAAGRPKATELTFENINSGIRQGELESVSDVVRLKDTRVVVEDSQVVTGVDEECRILPRVIRVVYHSSDQARCVVQRLHRFSYHWELQKVPNSLQQNRSPHKRGLMSAQQNGRGPINRGLRIRR